MSAPPFLMMHTQCHGCTPFLRAARDSERWVLSISPLNILGTWTTLLHGVGASGGLPAGESVPIPVAMAPEGPKWDAVCCRLRDLCLLAKLTHPPLRKTARHLGSMHAGVLTFNTRSRTGKRVNIAALKDANASRSKSARRCVPGVYVCVCVCVSVCICIQCTLCIH